MSALDITPEDDEQEFEDLTMEATFRFTIEVPKDWRPTSTIDNSWPDSVLEQITGPPGAELIDWGE